MTKQRTIVLLLDSVGVGFADDADKFNNVGANTVGHIIEKFPNIQIPNLINLGLLNILHHSSNGQFGSPDLPINDKILTGYAQEISTGKDTPSGHWEIMGCPVLTDWGYFRNHDNTFPPELLNNIYQKANLQGSLGNCIGSGTILIAQYGEEHLNTKLPIFYTSADSVFQIAAHEETFGLENLYALCEIARQELYQYNIGRVIARPFLGNNKHDFYRTKNRKDYSIAPDKPILFDLIIEEQGHVVAIGKTADIFAHQSITQTIKASGLTQLADATLKSMQETQHYQEPTIIFTNFVDFDSQYGHRRDIKGYKEALEYFDTRLDEILSQLTADDLLIITADHGCDPSWSGTDHTREYIPIIAFNQQFKYRNIGKRATFADIGQSIAQYLQLKRSLQYGNSFI